MIRRYCSSSHPSSFAGALENKGSPDNFHGVDFSMGDIKILQPTDGLQGVSIELDHKTLWRLPDEIRTFFSFDAVILSRRSPSAFIAIAGREGFR
jgi:hypothetical protein